MGFLRSVADWVRNNVPLVGGSIADAIEWIEGSTETWAARLWDAAYTIFTLVQNLWIGISEAAYRFAKLLQDWFWQAAYLFGTLWTSVVDFFTWVWDSFRDWVSARIRDFTDWLNRVWPGFRDTITNVWRAWDDFVRDPWGTIQKAGNQIWGLIWDRIKPTIDGINKAIADARNWLQARIDDVGKSLDNARRELESRINDLNTWARNAVNDINQRFDKFKRETIDWLNNVAKGLDDLTKNFGKYVTQGILIWEAAKGAARKRVASEIADVIEKPEVQTGLMGGETAAWLAHPAAGAAVTGTILGLEMWTKFMQEHPVDLPIETDNPVVKLLFKDERVEAEGPVEHVFGELLDRKPAVTYTWPDVGAGQYEPAVEVAE
jgi:phage-related protein